MKILFVMDPLKNLYPRFDSTLYLLKEFWGRGYETWTADLEDLSLRRSGVEVKARRTRPKNFRPGANVLLAGHRYAQETPEVLPLGAFASVLFRKEPPFDLSYLLAASILEKAPKGTWVSNDPAGIRKTGGEKLGCFAFAKWMPETVVSSDPAVLLDFRNRLKRDAILKPLDRKGGEGIRKIHRSVKNPFGLLERETRGGRKVLLQESVARGRPRDKRITLLDGNLFWAFEKWAAPGNFRTNLDQGGTVRKTLLTASEKRMIRELGPWLRSEGLHLTGLDVMDGKLIDLNVTCPGGFSYALALFPRANLIGAWADFLEARFA